MHRSWNSPRRAKVSLLTPVLLLLAALIAGCGASSTGAGSGSSARSLLTETFSGSHPINSGKLSASLSIDPTGSSAITQPVTLSFSGPFQSRGTNKLPASDFTIAVDFQGQTGQLGILSTGTAGYVTLRGSAYQLPAKDFQQLEGGVSSLGGGSSKTSTLSGLGIHPQNWLTNPTVVGSAQVGGVSTEHIHGSVALGPMLKDLSKVLAKEASVSSATQSLSSISAGEQAAIEREVKHASFDLWTGASDHTIRKLTVTATLPVSGTASSELGGMTSAKLSFTLGYSDVGQSQTITAPSSAKPYKQFQQAISALVLEIEDAVVGASGGSSSSSGATGSTGTGASGGVSSYSQCISAAGGSVAKIQKCAALLNSGG